MYELYQIRVMLSQMTGFHHHQPHAGPYHQQFYPPPPADYMGMVPRDQQPTTPATTTTTTERELSQLQSIQVGEKPSSIVDQNETIVVSTSSEASTEIPSATDTPVRLGNDESVSDSTPMAVAPTTRSLSFKPVQTKSLRTPMKQVERKKYIYTYISTSRHL